MIQSTIQSIGTRVPFAPFTGERIYMRRCERDAPLPEDLCRWQDTVDAMLDGVDFTGPVYLMVDQSVVRVGELHRRGGVHVDNYWHDGKGDHDRGHGNRPGVSFHGQPAPTPPTHGPRPGPSHRSHPDGDWREALIVASDVLGCVGYRGAWSGEQGPGGDCSTVDVSSMDRVPFVPGYAWRGDTAAMIHESIPVAKDALRTVVRLNVKGWRP